MDCRDVERFVHAYIDGEFHTREEQQVEAHLRGCSVCREIYEFETWFHKGLQGVHRRSIEHAPPNLIIGVGRALERMDRISSVTMLVRAVPAVAAILFLLALTWTATHRSTQMIDEAVIRHTRNLPLEVRSHDPLQVHSFLKDNLSFAMTVPTFRDHQIALMGARLSNIRDQDAAYLVYEARGGRVSMFIFPGHDLEFHEARSFRMGPAEFFLSKAHGYNVVLWKRRDVVYSVISDLEESELVRLISVTDGW